MPAGRRARATRTRALTALLAVGVAALVQPLPSATAADSLVGADVPAPTAAQAARDAAYLAYRDVLAPTLSVPIGWTGSTGTCTPGAPSEAAQQATLTALNYLRGLAGLAPVTFDRALSARAQKAALIMHAQGALSHQPPSTWACWSKEGSDAAQGNLYLGVTGAEAVVGYIVDPGDRNKAVGHRRWLLRPGTRVMGSGSTSQANAIVVHGPGVVSEPDTGPGFVAWPPAGYFPRQMEPSGRWSLSAPDTETDFSSAVVTVKRDGVVVPVRLERVEDGYGNDTLVFQVDTGDVTGRGEPVFETSVTGIRTPSGTVDHRWNTTLFDAEIDARQSVDFPQPGPGTFGDTLTRAATTTSGLAASLTSSTPGTCRVQGSDVSLTGIGVCTLTAYSTGDGVRRPAPGVVRSFIVARRPLVVRARNQVRAVGAPNPQLTVDRIGLVGASANSDLTGRPDCSTTADVSSPPGDYPVTCTLGTLRSARYTLSVEGGTLTVAAPPQGVAVAPGTLDAGQRTTVSYRGTPGARLSILARTQPATVFTRIGTVLLDAEGRATSSHRPQRDTRITAAAADGTLAAQQPLILVRSVGSLTATRSAGRSVTFTGRVYPARAGRLVNVYRNGTLAAQGRTDASGIYRIVRALPAGTWRVEARTPDDTYNLGTVTPTRTVRVP